MHLPKRLTQPYRDVGDLFGRYWRAYGGISALLFSPYLHVSVVLTYLLWPSWADHKWWETTLQVVPSILGFTLAGFTIWLGFGDEKFQRLLAKRPNGKSTSAYIGVSAGFVHFIVVQLLAVVAALIGGATDFPLSVDNPLRPIVAILAPIGHFLGYMLFVYSLLTALAATFGVFRTAGWFERTRGQGAEPGSDKSAINDIPGKS
jgi:hypothetical protein